MHRIYTPGASSTPPTLPDMPNPNYYPSYAAIFDPYTGYAIIEELSNVVLAAGLSLDPTEVNQVVTAINMLIANAAIANAFPIGYHGSAVPVYGNNTQFTQAFIRERDSSNAVNIAKAGSTTVDVSTTGLNGMAQSANLSGTVTVAASSTTVTFSTAYTGQVGDVITTAGGQSRRLASGAGTSWVSESAFGSNETAVTFKRGGRAPNTFYSLYAIAQASGANPGLILSSRDVAMGDTLTDLPSGYIYSQQLAFALRLDSSGNIQPFRVSAGWPSRPRIDYLLKIGHSNTDTQVLSGGTASTYTAIDLSAFIPKKSRMGILAYDSNTTGVLGIRESGNSAHELNVSGSGGSTYCGTDMTCPVSSSQQVDYKVTNNSADIYVQGFIVTEVP